MVQGRFFREYSGLMRGRFGVTSRWIFRYGATAAIFPERGDGAVAVAVPVAGLKKRFFNQKDFLINVWGYEPLACKTHPFLFVISSLGDRKQPFSDQIDFCQSGPPRPSDAISIEPNGIPNRPNRKIFKIPGLVFQHVFGRQALCRAETFTPDRSRAPP